LRLKRIARWIALLPLVAAGCGAVITPEPEIEATVPSPVETPAPTLPAGTPSSQQQPTAVPATPTPTPALIIHVVQEGETLGAIAYDYGVSLQALQAANGIDNPLLLQVGQELIIPTGEEELGEASVDLLLPTPTPLAFGVRGIGFYETPVGSLDCLGEIVNTTAFTLTNVQVRVTLFDASGVPLIFGDAFAATDILPPSARAPFRVLFVSPPPNFVSHDVARVRGEYTSDLLSRYLMLSVDSANGVPSGPQFEVTGTVRNPDPAQAASGVVVVVTTYDAEGRVTGYHQQTLDAGDGLVPGAALPFQMLFTPHGEEPTDFSVFSFGRLQEAGDSSQSGGQ